MYEAELTPKIEFSSCIIRSCGDVSQFSVLLLTFTVIFRISDTRCNESKWSYQQTDPLFYRMHFVLTNVKSLQGNKRNRVPILHMSLFTLFVTY